MESSDEDFLPDPERPKKRTIPPEGKRKKKPPDQTEASTSKGCSTRQLRGPKRKIEEDSTKGKCFFIFLSE